MLTMLLALKELLWNWLHLQKSMQVDLLIGT